MEKIRIKWSSKGMKRRKEICERFGFSSYLTLNHESEVYVRAEDPLVKRRKNGEVSVCKTCSQRLSLLI